MTKKILLTGATGLVGQTLAKCLLQKGYSLVVLGHRPKDDFESNFSLPCEYYEWSNPTTNPPPKEALNVDSIIHLMGEPIGNKKWTSQLKKSIYNSRVLSTKYLVREMVNSNKKYDCFISASAVGYYGDEPDQELNEESPKGHDFLAHVCVDWEQASKQAPCRNAQLRFGMILSANGGALNKITPLFECNVGAQLGHGKQWMSWVHIDDVISAIITTLETEDLQGPVNVVAPQPVTNKQFTQKLAAVLKTRAYLFVPKFVLKLQLGEMSNLVLYSQKTLPQKLLDKNFEFKYKNISSAFNAIYEWKTSSLNNRYYQEQWFPFNIDQVFSFFSNPANLEKVGPPQFTVQFLNNPNMQLKEKETFTLRIKFFVFNIKWQSRITQWEPKKYFIDQLIKGPYPYWKHKHTFLEIQNGTLVQDEIIYRQPFYFLGRIFLEPILKMILKKMFVFRNNTLPKEIEKTIK